MIKFKDILNEGLKKSEFNPVRKRVEKAKKLIKQADDELYAARSYVYQKLEDKAGDDYNDPKSIERAISNLKSSIDDGIRYMLRDPLGKASQILNDIDRIIKKL